GPAFNKAAHTRNFDVLAIGNRSSARCNHDRPSPVLSTATPIREPRWLSAAKIAFWTASSATAIATPASIPAIIVMVAITSEHLIFIYLHRCNPACVSAQLQCAGPSSALLSSMDEAK